MKDNAKGTVLLDEDDKSSNRKFCLETGGQSEDPEDKKGTTINN